MFSSWLAANHVEGWPRAWGRALSNVIVFKTSLKPILSCFDFAFVAIEELDDEGGLEGDGRGSDMPCHGIRQSAEEKISTSALVWMFVGMLFCVQKLHDKERSGRGREEWWARNDADETNVEKQDKDGKLQSRKERK